MVPRGFKTFLAWLSSMNNILTWLGHQSMGMGTQRFDFKTLRNCCPPPPSTFGTSMPLSTGSSLQNSCPKMRRGWGWGWGGGVRRARRRQWAQYSLPSRSSILSRKLSLGPRKKNIASRDKLGPPYV